VDRVLTVLGCFAALLSRQFVGLPRPRLESLLASFPRLVSPTSEHTVVESSGVRFVYTPLEDLYVLLITNTQSNILLDLSTLSLITRIATELGSGGRGGAIGELDVIRVNFEILSAWDEVISLGWRENVNLGQVRNVLEMESHEEKIQEIIARVRFSLVFSRFARLGLNSVKIESTEQGARSKGRAQATSKAIGTPTARDDSSRTKSLRQPICPFLLLPKLLLEQQQQLFLFLPCTWWTIFLFL